MGSTGRAIGVFAVKPPVHLLKNHLALKVGYDRVAALVDHGKLSPLPTFDRLEGPCADPHVRKPRYRIDLNVRSRRTSADRFWSRFGPELPLKRPCRRALGAGRVGSV